MFHPPFCPYTSCAFHFHTPAGKWWRLYGFHPTKTFGTVRRFQCKACGRTFSVQTFSLNYYAKRVLSFRRLERLAAASMGIRALSRELGCSCGTVVNRMDRLARQGIALHAILRSFAAQNESVCFDGLVSFDRSQYFPNDIGISISAESRFVLGISHAATRRSGVMRPDQRKRCDALYATLHFEPRAVERSFTEHLDMIRAERRITKTHPLVFVTDEKKEYRRAIRKHRLFLEQDERSRVAQCQVSSTWPRTRGNPLFASNYFDREVRKDQAQHRRETVCFSRNAANGMSRMYSYMVWHNYDKKYLIDWPKHRTKSHAEVSGIDRAAVRRERQGMFRQRAFLSRLELLPIDQKVWLKMVFNPREGRDVSGYYPKFATA